MSDPEGNVVVQIKYKDVEKTFSGRIDDVWLCVNKFFSEFVPSFEIASNLILKIDLQSLAKDCKNIVAFSEEGPAILIPRNKLSDNEALCLWLLANRLGYMLGSLNTDAASKSELQTRLGKDAKITGTRLGELVKNQMAAKTADEMFRITTFGIFQMQKEILPKIKARTGK